MTGVPVMQSHKFSWFYIEDEEKYEQLVDSLNPKGVREKKLQENLKKIKNHIKLKKSKKSLEKVGKQLDGSLESKQVQGDVEMSDQNEASPSNIEMEESELHIVFETDKFQQSLSHAIWFGKKIPPKRKQNIRFAQKVNFQTDSTSDLPNFEKCKEQLLTIAQFYTNTSKPYDREWEELEK